MPRPKDDDPEQSERFKELAVETEAWGDGKTLERAVKRISKRPREEPTTGGAPKKGR